MSRLPLIVLVAWVLAGVGLFANPETTAASYCYGPFDYAFQYTSSAAGTYHDPSCAPNYYFGWVAVNGQVQTPSHFPALGTNTLNHSNGFVGMFFNDPVGPMGHSWVQEGWFAGCTGAQGEIICATASSGLYSYDERYFAALDDYQIFRNSAISYSSGHINRIEWDGAHCWLVFTNYSVFTDELCDDLLVTPHVLVPRSGMPEVVSETRTSDTCVEMPSTLYGYSSPSTNNALRIKGAAGYVAWTSTLSHGGTADWDEANGSPQFVTTNLTILNADYKIQGSGSC